MNEKRLLALILGLFVVLSTIYALTTPVFEASDELWHYPMIRHLADGNPLPVQVFDPANAGPWKQEASQPPLYYYLGAALTFWIDTSDMEQVRWLNPHVDNGVLTVDGNTNLAIHDPAWNGWQGTLLAVRIIRLFSVLLGAGTVFLTYRIAKEVVPARPEIALGATAVNAFLPMFLFISGAVNNDNLAILLASLGVWLMIRTVTHDLSTASPKRQIRTWLVIGSVIGLAVLTKQGTFALLPLAWGTLFISRWQAATDKRGPLFPALLKAFIQSLNFFAILLLPVLLIAGWWYWRNIQLYGDFLGWSAFIAVLGERAQPASLSQLWDERWGFMLSFWGLFGGVNIPMPAWLYHLLNGVVITAVLGFVIYMVKLLRRFASGFKQAGYTVSAFIVQGLAFVIDHFGLVVCFLFSVGVVYGLIQWATTTWSSQGRLVFTALSALSTLLVLGLVGWLPRPVARRITAVLGFTFFLIAAVAPWLWIRPAYQADAYHPRRPYFSRPVALGNGSAAIFGDQLRLREVAIDPQTLGMTTVRPGQFVDVVLTWELLKPMDRNWSVFVHLNDPVLGVPIAQRDMYHGQGLRPTSLLPTGEEIISYYRLFVPETAVSPAQLQLVVGLYDFATNERLLLPGGQDVLPLGNLTLESNPGDLPNATQINFGDELTLMGYKLEPRRAQPGTTVTLTAYWQANRPLTIDYSISAQVVNLEDTTRWSSQDIALPTSTWEPGVVQATEWQLMLSNETPATVYPLILVVYQVAEDGSLPKLQLISEDGRITQDDFLLLTQIRVE